ncbi:MAG: QsdR family transcriptional regulator [Jiangellaceae bacterium]
MARRARGPRDVVDLATRCYLDGEPIEMSELAQQLGIGRATLYRWLGNRERLIETVLAEATDRTYRRAARHARGVGAARVLDLMRRGMRDVLAAEPLQVFTKREPLLFIRLATMPGKIEDQAATVIAEVIEEEITAGRLDLPVPARTVALGLVRISDALLYAPLFGRSEPEVETALDLAALLLGVADRRPESAGSPA